MLKSTFVAIALLGLGSCSQPQNPDDQAGPDRTAPTATAPLSPDARLVNKVWVVAEPAGRAPGSIYVFLSDGTLLMTSCVETYRLAAWRSESDSRLVVTEDAATRSYVDVVEVTHQDLRLRFELVSETLELKLRAAVAPTVCPDLPR